MTKRKKKKYFGKVLRSSRRKMESRDPKIWGPPFWKVIDTIAEAYPPNNASVELINATAMFFTTLKVLLPCEKCRQHYNDFVVAFPPPLSGKKELTDWIAKLKQSMTPVPPVATTTVPSKKVMQLHQQRIAQQRLVRMNKVAVPQVPAAIAKPVISASKRYQRPPPARPIPRYVPPPAARVAIPAMPAVPAPKPSVATARSVAKAQTRTRGCNCGARKI